MLLTGECVDGDGLMIEDPHEVRLNELFSNECAVAAAVDETQDFLAVKDPSSQTEDVIRKDWRSGVVLHMTTVEVEAWGCMLVADRGMMPLRAMAAPTGTGAFGN